MRRAREEGRAGRARSRSPPSPSRTADDGAERRDDGHQQHQAAGHQHRALMARDEPVDESDIRRAGHEPSELGRHTRTTPPGTGMAEKSQQFSIGI